MLCTSPTYAPASAPRSYWYEMGFEYHGLSVDGVNISQCVLRAEHTEAMHSALHDFSLSLPQILARFPALLDFNDTKGGWYANAGGDLPL